MLIKFKLDKLRPTQIPCTGLKFVLIRIHYFKLAQKELYMESLIEYKVNKFGRDNIYTTLPNNVSYITCAACVTILTETRWGMSCSKI